MEGIKQFFANLGAYAGPIVILLAEIFIAVILLNGFAPVSYTHLDLILIHTALLWNSQ